MSLNSKLSNTIRQFEDLRLATMKFAYRIVKLKFCEENKNDFYATFQEFSYSSFKKRYSKSNCQNRRYDLILPQKSSIDLGTVIGNIQCRNFLIFCHSDFTWNQLWSFWWKPQKVPFWPVLNIEFVGTFDMREIFLNMKIQSLQNC